MKLLFSAVLFLVGVHSISAFWGLWGGEENAVAAGVVDTGNKASNVVVDEHLSAAAAAAASTVVATPVNSRTLEDIIHGQQRYVLFNSRRLTGECLPICESTKSPTKDPTGTPTKSPTKEPTGTPTKSPSKSPTGTPTKSPTKEPTGTPTKSPTKEPACQDEEEFTRTKLNFNRAELTVNTLHRTNSEGKNGRLLYENIGYVKGEEVNLEVTVADGTKYLNDISGGGKNGGYGSIALMRSNDPKYDDGEANGAGTFDFCFKAKNNSLVTVDSFYWSILDFDMSAGKKLKDQVLINMNKVEDYSVWPDRANSEVRIVCEATGKAPEDWEEPCKNGKEKGRTIFQASEQGSSGTEDNPTNPMDLTPVQKKRVASFLFKDTSCFTMTFKAKCVAGTNCNEVSNRGLLFTGEAAEFFPGGCQLNLNPSEFILSPNKKYMLRYQPDGNLVLYGRDNATAKWSLPALWSTKTHKKGAGRVTMMGNGNLVVRGDDGNVLWSSNTMSRENWNSKLVLQDDGDLAIYNPNNEAVWHWWQTELNPSEFILSPNKKYMLRYQPDGNLVLYGRANTKKKWSTATAKWSTKTSGKGVGKAVMMKSGSFVVLGADGNTVLWSSRSNSSDNKNSKLVLQNDGNLVIYNMNGVGVWHTKTHN